MGASLSWYFGPGQACFEKSLFGAMMDRAELMASGSETCLRCEGSGFVGPFGTPARIVHRISPNEARDEDGERLRVCPNGKCKGRGNVPRPHPRKQPGQITIKSTRSEPSYMPDDSVMTAYAEISRMLLKVDCRLVSAMERYHGDIGAACEARSRFGRIVALYPMTDGGRKLLRAAVKRDSEKERPENLGDLRSDVIMGMLLEQEACSSLPARAAFIRAADEESRTLHEKARRAWKQLGGTWQ